MENEKSAAFTLKNTNERIDKIEIHLLLDVKENGKGILRHPRPGQLCGHFRKASDQHRKEGHHPESAD